MNGDLTIKAASGRGVSTFRFAFVRFWIFNGLALVAATIVASLIYAVILIVVDLSMGHPDHAPFKPILLALMLLPAVANTIMWAVISARVYMIAETKMNEALAVTSAS